MHGPLLRNFLDVGAEATSLLTYFCVHVLIVFELLPVLLSLLIVGPFITSDIVSTVPLA
jgi:hypothetical protein